MCAVKRSKRRHRKTVYSHHPLHHPPHQQHQPLIIIHIIIRVIVPHTTEIINSTAPKRTVIVTAITIIAIATMASGITDGNDR